FPQLGPYALYVNDEALPRAFVVFQASCLPDRSAIVSSLETMNFRNNVWLEGLPSARPNGSFEKEDLHPAQVVDYRPNRVILRVDLDRPGYLVLADVWYPGWTFSVDGEATPIYLADYLFRAVELPAGNHEVVFRFEPRSYQVGRTVSGCALLLVAVAC